MKRIYFLCFSGLLFILSVSTGCYYDKASLVYPNNVCDTSNVKLSGDLNNIMEVSCFSCHSNANASAFGGNYNLEDYNTIKNSANNGTLIGTISHAAGYLPMPQSGTKLSDCNINKFKAWVDAGAQDN